MNNIIEIKNMHKTFGTKKVLKGVDLNIVQGKCTAIFGLSGGGKSTIIKHIVGLLRPTSGDIIYDGNKNPISFLIPLRSFSSILAIFLVS